ncbi:MAG TPA: DUF5682 family protein, partial [Streptosporangiaceae bacterium]|nr:DUF5682 family protein [Streptosporangiaceae bacterium]
EARSARTGDVQQLMTAVPPLARVLRYGNVRRTDATVVRGVVDSLLIRVCAGMPAACASLDDAAAAGMLKAIEATEEAVMLVGTAGQRADWRAAQRSVADLGGSQTVVAGRCVRLLLDAAEIDPDEAGRRLARVLSARAVPAQAVRWLEGFLRGSGLLLVHDARLWRLLDDWLCGLSAESFDEAMPLLRRAFALFPFPERRQMAELVRGGRGSPSAQITTSQDDWDMARISAIVPVLAVALGVSEPADEDADG